MRQYCGQVGKQENCRIAVSVSLATEQSSLPATYQLYLPGDVGQSIRNGAEKAGSARKRSASRPSMRFALAQIRSLVKEDVPRGVVLADMPPTETITASGEELEILGLEYVNGESSSSTCVWPPGTAPLPPRAKSSTGRPASLLRRDEQHQPLSVKELAGTSGVRMSAGMT